MALLKKFEEKITKLKEEIEIIEKDRRQMHIYYQEELHTLDEIEYEAKKIGIYNGDLKEKIEQARKKVIDDYSFAIFCNDTGIEVGIDALEVEDFHDTDTRSNSVVKMSFDDQPGTSGTQKAAPQNSTVSDVKTIVTLG